MTYLGSHIAIVCLRPDLNLGLPNSQGQCFNHCAIQLSTPYQCGFVSYLKELSREGERKNDLFEVTLLGGFVGRT